MAEYSSGPRSYAANPFAASGAAGGGRTQAYASGLRNYASNQFAGTPSPNATTAMAPHLSQANPLSANLQQAYRELMTDPRASQYQQSIPDIDRLWKLLPKSPIFQAGYAHNPYVMQRAAEIQAPIDYAKTINETRVAQGLEPLSDEEARNQYYATMNTNVNNYSGE